MYQYWCSHQELKSLARKTKLSILQESKSTTPFKEYFKLECLLKVRVEYLIPDRVIGNIVKYLFRLVDFPYPGKKCDCYKSISSKKASSLAIEDCFEIRLSPG